MLKSKITKRNQLQRFIWVAVLVGLVFSYAKANDAYIERHVDYPKNNLLTNGSFEAIDLMGSPQNWNIKTSGPKIAIGKGVGYHKKNSFHVAISDYQAGNVSVESDKITVYPNQNYFFKIYTKSSVHSELLIHYFYNDGSDRYELTNSYPAVDEVWSTMSTPVRTNDKVTGISLVIHSFGNGYINLDNAYLITSDNLNNSSIDWEEQNKVPNGNLEKQDSDHQPTDWFPYNSGDNKVNFEYKASGNNHFNRVEVSEYRSGEAKWQYLPLPVTANQYQQFSLDYRSNTLVDIIVEYELADGSRRFSQIAELNPSDVWTRSTQTFETIPQAQKMFIALVLHRNGYIESDNFSLVTSKELSSLKTFNRSIISLTFDDGWLSQFTKALPILKQYDFPATFYINSATVGTNGFITHGQLQELQDNDHQIASHGHQHLDITAMSVKAFQDQLTKTKKYLERMLNVKIMDYASPFGKHSSQTDAFVRSIHSSHRGTDTGINTKSNFDRYNLQVLFIRNDSDAKHVQQFIDDTKISHGWLILVYHQLDASDNRNSITTEQFKQHLQVVKESNIQVVTVREALEEIDRQQ